MRYQPFPVQARLRGVGGTVNVFVLINREGSVARLCSVGPEELRMAAESAAAFWRFRRPTINQGTDPFRYIKKRSLLSSFHKPRSS
ncbi:MAG: energy transducer TonB [Bryobacterales bacterium]|nr:energy transducer TonB [Bryobacterales bacterium]